MRSKNITYRIMITGYLSLIFSFILSTASATNDQSLISPIGIKAIGSGMGDSAPAIVFNSNKNEYFIVYTDFDFSCTSNQELKGQVINSLTGEKTGSETIITSSSLPCATHSIINPTVAFNALENEYLVVYKSATALGAQIKYLSIDANSLLVVDGPFILDEDMIADPFRDLDIELAESSNVYAIGYHKENALSESALHISYISGSSKSQLSYSTVIDKNNSAGENKGIFNSKFLGAAGNILISFEINFTSGSEVHGIYVDEQSGDLVGNIFRISPTGSASTNYLNPALAYNASSNEVFVVYEEARAMGAEYALNHKIHGQLINASNGNLLTPTHQALTDLPSTPFTEESKLPSIVYSNQSQEYIISFYGIRYAASSDLYNLYFQRIDATNISQINSTSSEVISMIGTEVVKSSFLRSLPLAYNSEYNQFLFGWNKETSNDVQTQVWRYDNNQPKNLALSANSINEELPIGATISLLSADDPDPEDNTPIFKLVSGTGDDDNTFFEIVNNELKISNRLSFEDATNRSIRIRAEDSQGKYTDQNFTITINNINEKPSNLALSGSLIIVENSDIAMFSSSISVYDDDQGNTHIYELVVGDSSDNNSNFEIDQDVLKLLQPVNYEDTSRQYLRIKSTDNTGLYVEKAFYVDVTDVNEEPGKIELQPSEIPENDVNAAMDIYVEDPDKVSNYGFSMVSGEGSDDNDKFGIIDGKLKPTLYLDFETQSTYTVRLQAFDGVHDTTQVVTVSLFDVNDDPDSVQLTESRIETGQPSGSTVGQLIAYDQDESDNHSFTIIEGDQYFFISDTNLRISNSLEYNFAAPENNFYPVKVRVDDSSGGYKIETFTIEVVLFKDDEMPEILDFEKIEKYLNYENQSANLTISAKDNVEIDTVYFFYRPIRSLSDFVESNSIDIEYESVTRANVSVSININDFDDMGIEYYFTAVDAAGNSNTSALGYMYLSYTNKLFSPVNKSFDGNGTSYKIISNPYDLISNKVSKIFSDYPSSSKDTWRLYSFENNKETEIGKSTGTTINQGQGYWFNKTSDIKQPIIFETASVPENNKENMRKLVLKEGWNMIGNPYPFVLDWDFVLLRNNLSSDEIELFTYNKKYDPSTTLDEFEGGFVFVESNTDLIIPVDDPEQSGNRIAYLTEQGKGWLLQLNLENGNYINKLSGLGMQEGALASYDKYDRPLLPRFIDHLDISFNHPEHIANVFSKDVVEIQENFIWEFSASSNLKNKNVTLSWDQDLLKNAKNQLILYDVVNDKTIDVKVSPSYSFTIDNQSAFKAIYGDQAFIDETLGKIKIEALKPYPNPFTDNVSIPINLPYSKETYDIKIDIFNLMGEKVFEEDLRNLTHGLFQLEWNESQNRTIEKGIYIYSIKVKNGFLANNFHGRVLKN